MPCTFADDVLVAGRTCQEVDSRSDASTPAGKNLGLKRGGVDPSTAFLLCCSASSTVSRGREHAHLALHSLLTQHTRRAHRRAFGFLENPMPASRPPMTLGELAH